MDENEMLEQFELLLRKEVSLGYICSNLKISDLKALSLVGELENRGLNISVMQKDDDIYMYSRGERESSSSNIYHYNTDNHEFKAVVVSDPRFCSKSQQMTIYNDIYLKGYKMGFRDFILCGNMTEGIYPIKNVYSDSNFLNDTFLQTDYVVDNYPEIDGCKTYFITGVKDNTHLTKNGINIGKRISDKRDDMIFLGQGNCNFYIDKTNMLIFNQKLKMTYTVSYRAQKQIDSFRQEDKPDILLYGGGLQFQKFTYRDVCCLSVPSVCASTEEMLDHRYNNSVGACYVTIKTDNRGKLKNFRVMESAYYDTIDDDYLHCKTLKMVKEKK